MGGKSAAQTLFLSNDPTGGNFTAQVPTGFQERVRQALSTVPVSISMLSIQIGFSRRSN